MLQLETARIGFRRYDVLTVDVGVIDTGPGDENWVRYYVDRDTSLVRRVEDLIVRYRDLEDRRPLDVFLTWDLEDYVPVDGVMMPSRVRIDASGYVDTFPAVEFAFNVDYDPELFDRRAAYEDGPEGWKRRTAPIPAQAGPEAVFNAVPSVAPTVGPTGPGIGDAAAPTPAVIDVAVVDAGGRPVTTLPDDAFRIYEEGEERSVVSVVPVEAPHQVFVVDDCSGSVYAIDNFAGDSWTDVNDFSIATETTRPGLIPGGGPLVIYDWIPFQMAIAFLLQGLRNPYRVALAEFGDAPRMLRDFGELPATVGGAVRLREREDAFGPDCVGSEAGSTARFDERLDWITERLEAIPGRKSVVWFGPPKDLPGVYRSIDRLRLNAGGQPSVETPFEQTPELQRIREAIRSTGVKFVFVLGLTELSTSYPGEPERAQRRYRALRLWADASGGRLLLLRDKTQVDALIDELNQEPATSYRVTYLSSADPSASETPTLNVRVGNPALDVLQSGPRRQAD